MIVRNFSNYQDVTEPTQVGITCYVEASSISLPPLDFEKDFCYCQTEACLDEYMYAFVGATDYENDKFTLFSQVQVPHTVSFFIKKKGATEIPLLNNIHGILTQYDTNTKVFIVDWEKVANELGYGVYSLRIEWNYTGVTRSKSYKSFMCLPFDTVTADSTIKIKSINNGEIERGYYYNDWKIERTIRLKGTIQNEQIITEINSNDNAIREKVQVQDREWSEYDISIPKVNEKILKELVQDYFMGSPILVTDYNIHNKTYKDLKVRKKGIEQSNVSKFHTSLVVKVEDYTKRVKNNL